MKIIPIKKIDETLYYEKLSNGLDVYMLKNDKVNNFYITLTCKYGAVDTEFKIGNKVYNVPNGVAHFLEHVNFNEENGTTAHEYFDKLGSSINAFTTFDFTSYEVMASNNFEDNLNHLLDYVQTPVFNDDLVKKEKGIIVEEVRMGKNNPGHKLYYGMNKSLLKNDKRKNLVTGEVKDVKSISTNDLKLVYDAFYHPENMFLIITGNFDIDNALKIVKKNQNSKRFKNYKKPIVIKDKEEMKVINKYKEIEANVEISKCKISFKMDKDLFKGYDETDLNIYLNLLLSINFGGTSYLRDELYEKNLITHLGTSIDTTNDLVIISIVFESKDIDTVRKIIIDKLYNLEANESDLRRKSKAAIAALINDYDDIEYVNTDIMDQLLYSNKIIDNIYDRYNNLKLDDMLKIKKLLDFRYSSTVLLVPYKG